MVTPTAAASGAPTASALRRDSGLGADAPVPLDPSSRVRALGRPWSTRMALVQFVLGGVAALALLGLVGTAALRTTARDEGLNDARALVDAQTRFVVQPALTDELVTGDAAGIAAFDGTVRRVLLEPGVVHIRLRTADGHVVYSDDRSVIGAVVPLEDGGRQALAHGSSQADVLDVALPAPGAEPGDDTGGPLVAGYDVVRTPTGVPLVYEAVFRTGAVVAPTTGSDFPVLPAFLLGLVALELFQLPLAWRLSKRLQRSQQEGEALMRLAAEASDHERRRIARDLHDGVVQWLAGASYSLSAAAGDLRGTAPDALVDEVAAAADVTRDSVRGLRSLIVDIYPPDLAQRGLHAALEDLVAAARDRGVEAGAELPAQCPLPTDRAAVLYRAAQECVRNALSHAQPHRIWLVVAYHDGTASLLVGDDGVGFDPTAVADDGRPRFGLRLLGELVGELGGSVAVDSDPGAGTTVVVEVPTR